MDTKKRVLIITITISVILVVGGLFLLGRPQKGTTPRFIYQISNGSEWGNLSFPQEVMPYKGKIFVSDPTNSRIIVFKDGGKYLFQFEKVPIPGKNWAPYPYGLSTDGKGNIYVTDSEAGKILIYNEQGRFLRYFAADAQYTLKPAGIFISNGRVYVSDLK